MHAIDRRKALIVVAAAPAAVALGAPALANPDEDAALEAHCDLQGGWLRDGKRVSGARSTSNAL